MKPIIAWELRQRKAYLFWWTACTIALITLLLFLYPSIRDQADSLNKAINQLPSALKDLKTGSSQVDIASPIGYLNSQLYYVTLPLLQIIMAIGLGSSLIARDEQNHTLELILARPISRAQLLMAKALSGIILVTFVSVIGAVVTATIAHLVKMQLSSRYILLASLFTMLFSLSFGAIAFMLTAAGNATRRTSTAIVVAVSFGGYLLASLSDLSRYIETPSKLLPYHYFNPSEILAGHVPRGLVIYLVGVAVVCVVVSSARFSRRDLD